MRIDSIHEVIEALAPSDEKNCQAVEDIFAKPVEQIANRLTLRDCIKEITKDERATDNIMRELMSFEPQRQHGTEGYDVDADKEPEGAELLLILAETKTELCFKDQDENFYALIHNKVVDGYEIVELDSEDFQQKLGVWYHDQTRGKLPKREWKIQVTDYLKGAVNELAKIDEKKFNKKLYNRAVLLKTPEGYVYYYNLANAAGEIVKITKDDIQIVKQNPEVILFKKLPDDHEQVAPNLDIENFDIDGKKKVLDYLDRFLHTFNFEKEDTNDSDDKHIDILKCYILVLFLNAAAIPINLTTGPEGCNKTTFQRQLTSLKDPKENRNAENLEDGTLALTTELDLDINHTWERFLVIHENDYTCFDNLDEIPRQIFDEMCVAVTRYNITKREHFKMLKIRRLVGRRPMALTAVHFSSPKPDFWDRVLHTKMVAAKGNKSDEQVLSDFHEIKPKLLGFIFNKIKEFLPLYDQLKREIKPKTRLSNFEIQCEIMSRVLGNNPNKFQDAWSEKKKQQVETALEDDSLALGLFNYLKKKRMQIIDKAKEPIYGTEFKYIAKDQSSDILSTILLDTVWKERFLSEDDRQGWWKNAKSFGAALNKRRGQLAKIGIVIPDTREKIGNKQYRIIDFTAWAKSKSEDYWKEWGN